MKCRDVMTADPACCLSGDSVARAAQLMKAEDVGPVLVVSDDRERRLVGIVTDRDLTIEVLAAGRDPKTTRVDEVMTRGLVTCAPDDDVEEAIDAMAEHQVRRIPVVEASGRLVGIIAQADVARTGDEHRVGEMVEEISAPGSRWGRRSTRGSQSYPSHDASDYSQSSGRSSYGSYPQGSSSSQSGDTAALAGLMLAGAAIGATLMYLFDTDAGSSRRTAIRDKSVDLYNRSAESVRGATRDASTRARDLASKAGSMVGRRSQDDSQSQEL